MWLPKDQWVMQHWLPFDEERLYATLGIDNRALDRWLRNDHRTIAALARRRTGLGPERLAKLLVAPRAGGRARADAVRLRKRAKKVLTQGHLAQHLFFHYFHGTRALERTWPIFGVSRSDFKRLRLAGWTPRRIGRFGGQSRTEVRRGMLDHMRRVSNDGVRRGAHSRAQAKFMLRRRTALLGCFLRRPLARLDLNSPFGERDNGHGPHARAARSGLVRGSKQRTARGRPGCCWIEPRLMVSPLAPHTG
jgi:hypothetical protein